MYNANQEEQKVLGYWEKNKTFEKSVTSRPEKKPYHFYDGPPYATGLPHYGHIVASVMKDVVPRYWTMRGFRVERKWGWDCHGLPVENIVEKELNLGTKRDIENYGIAKFNEACRATVLKYTEEWKKTIRRVGRWVDMENDYKTMNLEFMESVWWVVRQLWDKELIYKGYKPMHICPRCVTPLSNFEVTQNYKDIKDISAVAKFRVVNPEKINITGDLFVLAWTTTPWTLPGNVLLAAGAEISYLVVKNDNQNYIVAKERLANIFKDKQFEILKELKGENLVGLEYEPVFPYFKDTAKAFRVVTGDFVSTEDGTGIVHIAPAFGDEDFNVGEREKLPLVHHVNMEGKFVPAVTDFAGMEVKPIDDVTKTDVEIIKWLAHNGKLFSKEKIEHSYPHCWRCDTPLLNYATTSWFVKVSGLKDQLLKNNEKITWVPEHIKFGRFGKWLENARDWAISRNRYWSTPLPLWESEDGEIICVQSAAELEKLSGKKVTDLHKHKIDDLTFETNGKKFKRVPEVLDVWFDSGSMPYGQMHYPFENQEKFESGFPAEFIAEGQDQTRGWFYTLHVLSTALTSGKSAIPGHKNTSSFKNVIVNGIVLAEDGKKMSKRLKNYSEPELIMDKYGADALRYYLITSPVMQAENLNFAEAGVREMYNKVVNTLYNVLEFYQMFAVEEFNEVKSDNILDKWMVSKLNQLVKEVTEGMEAYKLNEAGRPILDFITELSQWYVRRSRDRFKGENEQDKLAALSTLRQVLTTLSKIIAPFTPFLAEKVYYEVTGDKESVHLQEWPKAGQFDTDVLSAMNLVRSFTTIALMQRAQAGIKVRQPLNKLSIKHDKKSWPYWEDTKNILADEINVKEVVLDPNITGEEPVKLDTNITPELKKEGLVREIVRTINQIRKEMKLTIHDKVKIAYSTSDEMLSSVMKSFENEISRSVLADEISEGGGGQEAEIDDRAITLLIQKN